VANDWRKGGVGAGVLTLAYLARTRTGPSYVVSVFAQNRSRPIDPAVAGPVMFAAIKGAFTRGAPLGFGSRWIRTLRRPRSAATWKLRLTIQ
jgi:hypothetical protein